MKKVAAKKFVALGAIALVSGSAFAQTSTSSVQRYGIVDVAYRHTNNEGPAANNSQTLNQLVGGGMSQSRWGINVSEDLGGGTKALVNMENRFGADTGTPNSGATGGLTSSSLGWACKAAMVVSPWVVSTTSCSTW